MSMFMSLNRYLELNGCDCHDCIDRYHFEYYYPWSYCNEKSRSAKAREAEALKKFSDVKEKVEAVLLEKSKVTIKLGCLREESLFSQLPHVLVESICIFAGLPEPTHRPKQLSIRQAKSTTRSGRAIRKINYSEDHIDSHGNDTSKEIVIHEYTGKDLTDFGLYQPGSKLIIPLLKPDTHLTSACWRDFAKAVRENDGWDVKRIAATEEEKKEYKQQLRKGSAYYFVNAIYAVPDEPNEYKPNLEATQALRAVINSAIRSKTGQADQKSLKCALEAGYSKHFISVEVDKVVSKRSKRSA